MKKIDIAKSIIKNNGGIIKTVQLNKAGIQNSEIKKMCESGEIERVRHGYYQIAGQVEISEEKMIAPMDEKRGKLLLAEILNGGNFGKHFTKYGHFTQQGMAKKYFLKIWRNMHFVRYFPAEALSEPVFRTWHFLWRMWQK